MACGWGWRREAAAAGGPWGDACPLERPGASPHPLLPSAPAHSSSSVALSQTAELGPKGRCGTKVTSARSPEASSPREALRSPAPHAQAVRQDPESGPLRKGPFPGETQGAGGGRAAMPGLLFPRGHCLCGGLLSVAARAPGGHPRQTPGAIPPPSPPPQHLLRVLAGVAGKEPALSPKPGVGTRDGEPLP